FAAQHMPLDAARARFELAKALDGTQPEVAVGEARTALGEFERLGAPREADAAAAFLRERGVARRTRPKGLEVLSRREREVLALLREGLTNAEIAARLYISTKTAGNHVSNVLSKVNLRNRTEAAAYAARFLAHAPTGKKGTFPTLPAPHRRTIPSSTTKGGSDASAAEGQGAGERAQGRAQRPPGGDEPRSGRGRVRPAGGHLQPPRVGRSGATEDDLRAEFGVAAGGGREGGDRVR